MGNLRRTQIEENPTKWLALFKNTKVVKDNEAHRLEETDVVAECNVGCWMGPGGSFDEGGAHGGLLRCMFCFLT